MSIVVDENVEPLMKAEIEFERLNKEAKILMNSVPTKNAIVDFINRIQKLIVVSRNLNEEERGIVENKWKLLSILLAIDGIGFIVNNDNPIKRVTSVDLKNIFRANINTGQISKYGTKSKTRKQNHFLKVISIRSKFLFKEKIRQLMNIYRTAY
ncbi:MAG: substrate-binding domain-containing protein [Ignavibacteria bacterium]